MEKKFAMDDHEFVVDIFFFLLHHRVELCNKIVSYRCFVVGNPRIRRVLCCATNTTKTARNGEKYPSAERDGGGSVTLH